MPSELIFAAQQMNKATEKKVTIERELIFIQLKGGAVKMELNSKTVTNLIDSIKISLKTVANQENFWEIKDDLGEYMDEIYEEEFEARMENTHCWKCNELGVRAEIKDIVNEDTKLLCQDCFNAI